MEDGEAVTPQLQPQRIIGSKQGYYKVSYTLPATSNDGSISKPPEWVPKSQVPPNLVLIWRSQRSERLAFIQRFKSKKTEENDNVFKTISSSDSSQVNPTTRQEAPNAQLSRSTDAENTVPQTEDEPSQNIGSILYSETEGVQEQEVQPSVPEVVSSRNTYESTNLQREVQPTQTSGNTRHSDVFPASGNKDIPHSSIIKELPSVPSEHNSKDVETITYHVDGSSEQPITISNDRVDLRDENSVIQSSGSRVFRAVRDAANAALGAFVLSQDDSAGPPIGPKEKNAVPTDATPELAAPNKPHVSNESNKYSSNSLAEDIVHPDPLPKPAIVQKPSENVAEDNSLAFEASANCNASKHKPNNDADNEQQYVSRSGRRIRRPVSTTTESFDEATQVLNAKVSQQTEEIKFLKTLYEDASNSATRTTEELRNAKEQIRLLKDQLATGINTQRSFYMSEVEQWKQEADRVKKQLSFLEQREHQLNDDIRRKAAEWDKHLEQELKDKEFREKRWKEWDQRKQREGLTFESAAEKPEQELLSKELEELAAEANEVSNTEQDAPAKDQPRISRRRAAAAAAVAIAAAATPQDAAMNDRPLAPAISTADSGTPSELAQLQDGQMPKSVQASLSQDHTFATPNDTFRTISPEKRPHEASADVTHSEMVPAHSPVNSENTNVPRPVAAAPLTPLRWKLATSTDLNPKATSTGPRWKRRRQ